VFLLTSRSPGKAPKSPVVSSKGEASKLSSFGGDLYSNNGVAKSTTSESEKGNANIKDGKSEGKLSSPQCVASPNNRLEMNDVVLALQKESRVSDLDGMVHEAYRARSNRPKNTPSWDASVLDSDVKDDLALGLGGIPSRHVSSGSFGRKTLRDVHANAMNPRQRDGIEKMHALPNAGDLHAKEDFESGGGSSGVLRYALHLRFVCPASRQASKAELNGSSVSSMDGHRDHELQQQPSEDKRRFYLYSDLRVVFPQRRSDSDEGKVGCPICGASSPVFSRRFLSVWIYACIHASLEHTYTYARVVSMHRCMHAAYACLESMHLCVFESCMPARI
jgi:hypothetical protein